MEQVRPARVARTALLTVGAIIWGIAIGNGWVPTPGPDSGVLLAIGIAVVLLVMCGLPLYNLKQAVLDGRALESSGSWSVMKALSWLITLANVVINFMLLAVAVFFAAMLITGPAVG